MEHNAFIFPGEGVFIDVINFGRVVLLLYIAKKQAHLFNYKQYAKNQFFGCFIALLYLIPEVVLHYKITGFNTQLFNVHTIFWLCFLLFMLIVGFIVLYKKKIHTE